MTEETRRGALGLLLAEEQVDALLVSSRVNVGYVTGFAGSAGAVLIDRDGVARLAVDRRYAEQAAIQAPELPLVVTRAYGAELIAGAAREGMRRIGFEAHVVTVEDFEALRLGAPGIELVPMGRPVERLREVKDAQELTLIRRACRISEQALAELLTGRLGGRTEADVAAELDRRLRDGGADGPAFDTIVASGPASALPHHVPDSRVLDAGDLVVIDFGARVEGYAADMTRTVLVRGEGAASGPAAWQAEIHALVADTHQQARAALVAGAETGDVDSGIRSAFERAGMAGRYLDGLGHGIGREVHERPIIGLSPSVPLRPGMVLAVEPGLYLAGQGGVRIEDVLLVRGMPPASVSPGGQNGSVGAHIAAGEPAEALTTMTRDLLVLP